MASSRAANDASDGALHFLTVLHGPAVLALGCDDCLVRRADVASGTDPCFDVGECLDPRIDRCFGRAGGLECFSGDGDSMFRCVERFDQFASASSFGSGSGAGADVLDRRFGPASSESAVAPRAVNVDPAFAIGAGSGAYRGDDPVDKVGICALGGMQPVVETVGGFRVGHEDRVVGVNVDQSAVGDDGVEEPGGGQCRFEHGGVSAVDVVVELDREPERGAGTSRRYPWPSRGRRIRWQCVMGVEGLAGQEMLSSRVGDPAVCGIEGGAGEFGGWCGEAFGELAC